MRYAWLRTHRWRSQTSRSEMSAPGLALTADFQCGAARTNHSREFRLTGRTRQSLRIARLLVWERITTCGSARALRPAGAGASVKHLRNIGEAMASMCGGQA
jgi:hypothetical protein